jgi:hypothetical protein
VGDAKMSYCQPARWPNARPRAVLPPRLGLGKRLTPAALRLDGVGMYLPTWLVFAFLTVSAFAPVAGRWSGWWIVYYGALLICWVFVSGAAKRREHVG